MKITWTRRAARHLRSACEFWTEEKSQSAADSMLDHIFSTIELLGRHPGLGRSGRVPGTRELVLRPLPFIVVYRVRRSRIEVVALLHGARKWPSGF